MIIFDEHQIKRLPTLAESFAMARSLEGGVLLEDLVKLTKDPRTADDAKSGAKGAAVKGFNPYEKIAKSYYDGQKAVKKFLRNEFKKAKKDEDKITFSCNFIHEKMYYQPKDGILIFGIHIYMPAKKGAIARLFTGSIGAWGWGDLGVKAMQQMIEVFAGPVWAKQVTKKTVFNAIGEAKDEGKTSYFFCLKLPQVD